MSKTRILVVDDNAVGGEALTAFLHAAGYEVNWAANAEAALTRLKIHPYDVFVVDHFMPGLDGLSLLKRLRDGGSRVPAVLMTAAAEDVVEWMKYALASLQPAALLRKPFDVSDLVALIASLLAPLPGAG